MEKFFWRPWARVVAYIDLVLWILISMVVVSAMYLATTGLYLSFEVTDEKVIIANDPDVYERFKVLDYWWAWVEVAWFAAVTGLQLWASMKLLSATEFGRDVNEALEKARFWRNVTFVFLVMDVTVVVGELFFYGFYFWMILEICFIIWRVNFLFIVYKYMEELETTLATPGVGDAEAGYINSAGKVYVK